MQQDYEIETSIVMDEKIDTLNGANMPNDIEGCNVTDHNFMDEKCGLEILNVLPTCNVNP